MGKTSRLIEYFMSIKLYFVNFLINLRKWRFIGGIKVIFIFKTQFINKYYEKV